MYLICVFYYFYWVYVFYIYYLIWIWIFHNFLLLPGTLDNLGKTLFYMLEPTCMSFVVSFLVPTVQYLVCMFDLALPVFLLTLMSLVSLLSLATLTALHIPGSLGWEHTADSNGPAQHDAAPPLYVEKP